MRLVVQSIRESRRSRLCALLLIVGLMLLLVGRAPSGFAADVTYTITPGGPPVTGTITTAGDNAALTFTGTAGQRIFVNLTSVTIGTSPCCSALASIKKPDGSNLVSPKQFGTAGGFLDTVSLPSAGTYTIYIDPAGSSTGSVTVTAYDVPADLAEAITPGGSPVSISLTTPGRNAGLTFSGNQGQRISVAVGSVTIGSSPSSGAFVSIKKPDGANLTGPSQFGTAGKFVDTVSLPTSGTYTIYVDPAAANTGGAIVTAYDVPPDLPGTITIAGPPLAISLTTPGRNARLSFEGAAGQVVRLTTTAVTIGSSPSSSAWASIENPDGTLLGLRQTFGTAGGNFIRTLTSTGMHTVFIDPVDGNTGDVTVSVSVAGASPVDGGRVRTPTPTLRADLPANPNTDYWYEVASDVAFAQIVASGGPIPTTSTFHVPPAALKNGTTYYWRWRTTTTGWSNARSFISQWGMFGTREDWPMWSKGPLAVNKVTGNLVVSLPGPSYPTAVGSMAASVTHNSLDPINRGLGAGWTLNGGPEHGAAPTRLVNLHVLTGEDKMDAAEVLYADGGSAFFGHVGETNTYIAEPGDGALLSKNADATWTLIDVDGSIYTFDKAHGVSGVAPLKSVEVVDASPGKGKLTYGFSLDGTKITSIADGAGRSLTFTWNVLNPSACPGAILCITGPDGVTWRYIGDTGGGAGGRLLKVNNGTRDVAAVEYDIVDRVVRIFNANDLDPTAASPGYNPDHEIVLGHWPNGAVMWIKDWFVIDVNGGSHAITTWFDYYPGNVQTTPTRAAHGLLPAGSTRTAAGYAAVTPPRQHGAQNPKVIKSYYDAAGHEIETVDILGNVTMAGYDTKDHLLWTEDEEGNPTDDSWDTVNDVLLSTTGPDPDGAGPLGRPLTTNRYDERQVGTSSAPGAPLQGLQASYYDNRNLAGRPAVRQTDSAVDFNWATGAPPPLAVSDNFSVRWVGNLIVGTGGSYTFATNADDGTRLTIDDIQVIDNWVEQSATAVSSRPVTLTAGTHKVRLEYFDATGPAEVELRWSCTGCSPSIPLQAVPSSALRPAWLNQTSAVSPVGKVAFSHFADPASMRSDYTLVRLADGTNVITSFNHDAHGRATQKVMPKGNAARTIDANGNLQGTPDTTYATTWAYYGPIDTAAPPAACPAGSTVNQGELLKEVKPHGVATTTYVYDDAGRPIATTKGRARSAAHTTMKDG